jgi:hypothetical protein
VGCHGVRHGFLDGLLARSFDRHLDFGRFGLVNFLGLVVVVVGFGNHLLLGIGASPSDFITYNSIRIL